MEPVEIEVVDDEMAGFSPRSPVPNALEIAFGMWRAGSRLGGSAGQ